MTPRTWLSLTVLAVILSLSAAACIKVERWYDGKVRQIEEDEARYEEGLLSSLKWAGDGSVYAFRLEPFAWRNGEEIRFHATITENTAPFPNQYFSFGTETPPCTPDNKGQQIGVLHSEKMAECDGREWVVVEERP